MESRDVLTAIAGNGLVLSPLISKAQANSKSLINPPSLFCFNVNVSLN